MKLFLLTLKCSDGRKTDVSLHANDKEDAIRRLMNLERCGRNSITKVKELQE